MYNLTIKPIGNLAALRDVFSQRRISAATAKIRDAVLMGMANEYLKLVLQAIDSGSAEGPALSDSWTAEKGSSKPWLDTMDLRNAIVIERPTSDKVTIGIPNTAKNRRGERLDLIAMILEIGSLKIPARPLFEPAAKTLLQNQRPDWVDKVVIEAFGLA